MISASLVGLSGIFPLLVIPLDAGKALRNGESGAFLKLLLSFAVGALLGDVFLHLLPEAWAHLDKGHDHQGHTRIGLWVMVGLLSFLIIEKMFPDSNEESENEESEEEVEKVFANGHTDLKLSSSASLSSSGKETSPRQRKPQSKTTTKDFNDHTHQNGKMHSNGHAALNGHVQNGHANGVVAQMNGVRNGVRVQNGVGNGVKRIFTEKVQHIKTSGWLNLMANVIDNFTHGLAVASSYCVSNKVGFVTTIAILLHEIPHEIGDFAILLRAGFDRWKAAKAQILTASGGLVGALTALTAESTQAAGDRTAWILPFTSGGFLYIALVTVVPDLLKETCPKESLKQLVLLGAGIFTMVGVTLFVE